VVQQEHDLGARELWAALTEQALTPRMRHSGFAAWMNNPETPFCTTSDGHVLRARRLQWRKIENELRVPGVQLKSVFSSSGLDRWAEALRYGMQALHRLATAGWQISSFEVCPHQSS
jgi:hypothetical protein